MLLDAGSDVNAPNDHGSTPLMTAVNYRSLTDVVELLLAAGADPDVRNSQGGTALDLARSLGHLEYLSLLEAPPGAQ